MSIKFYESHVSYVSRGAKEYQISWVKPIFFNIVNFINLDSFIKKCNYYVVFILVLHWKALVDKKKSAEKIKRGENMREF